MSWHISTGKHNEDSTKQKLLLPTGLSELLMLVHFPNALGSQAQAKLERGAGTPSRSPRRQHGSEHLSHHQLLPSALEWDLNPGTSKQEVGIISNVLIAVPKADPTST